MEAEKTFNEMRSGLEKKENIWANNREGEWFHIDKVILVPGGVGEKTHVHARKIDNREWFRIFTWLSIPAPSAHKVSSEEAIKRYKTYLAQQD